MAKDPAFLFYYDRFISGTYTMTDEQVGQYIRLLCIQANKGYVSESHMKNICKTYDKDVISKFVDTGGGKYVNEVLASIMEKRMAYTESRRNNRKGKNFNEDMNNISETYDKHMVNVNKNVNKDKNKEGGVGEKPLQMIERIWKESGFIHTGDLKDAKQISERLIGVDISRATEDQISELEVVFRKIITYLKQDGNTKYYGSFPALNKHLDKILTDIKNGNSKNGTPDSPLRQAADAVLGRKGK